MFERLHQLELPLIHWLHTFRTPWLDDFFIFMNFFDTYYFFSLLIPAVWLGSNWRSGARVFYILSLSGLINYTLKVLFEEPRPFIIEPGLNLISMKSIYGFPSGAAQTAMILACLLIGTFRTAWAWILGFLFFFLLSLSRVYLGVHFPSDLAGGWMVGALLVLVYYRLFPKIEKALEKMPLAGRFLLSQIPLIAFAIAYAKGLKTPMIISLSFLSIGWGLCLSALQNCFLAPSASFKQGFCRAALGIAGVFGLNFFFTSCLQPLFTGFWLSYLAGRVIQLWHKRKI